MQMVAFAFDDYTNSWQRPPTVNPAAYLSGGKTASTVTAHNIVPDVIRSEWYKLSRSKLPGRCFAVVVKSATAAKGRKAAGYSTINGFINFWQQVNDFAAEPVLSAAPDGSLVAEWFSSPDNSLVVMFDPDGNLHFSLFREGQPLEGVRDSGAESQVVALLTNEGDEPFSWSDAD